MVGTPFKHFQEPFVDFVLIPNIEKYIAVAYSHLAMYSKVAYCYALFGFTSSPVAIGYCIYEIQSLQLSYALQESCDR